MLGTLIVLGTIGGVIAKVAYDDSIGNENDTVVEHGDTWFRGRYSTASGKCFRCDGTGSFHGKTCRKCGGSGVYEHTTWHR